MSLSVAELTTYTSRLNGGVFFVLTALLPRLQAQGTVQPSVLGYRDPKTEEDRALWQAVPVQALTPWPPRYFGYSPRFRPALERSEPQVIHSHGLWTYLSLAALQVHKRCQVPMVVSPHGMLDPWALALSSRKKRVVGRLFQDEQLRRAAVVHALNAAEARAIRSYGVRGPVVVIPNGVEIDPVPSAAPAPWAEHPVARRPRILLFMARLHPKKGLRELFAAWRIMQSQPGPARDWGLVVAGWDEAGIRSELTDYALREGLADSICFCGPLMGEHKAAALSHAHACVLPSFSEGLPMTVLEAWSYGLPALMTPACNLPEGIECGAALSCEPRPDSIADAIDALARMDDAQRAEMGGAAKALVRERFDWNTIAAAMERLYSAVAGGEPPPAELCAD